MRLSNIEITNYRSCLKTKFRVDKSLTCLIGANGVGKSNILNALLLFSKLNRPGRYWMRAPDKGRYSTSTISLSFLVEENKKIYLKATIYYETDEKNVDEVQFATAKINLREINNSKKWIDVPLELFSYGHRPERMLRYTSSYRSLFRLALNDYELVKQPIQYLTGISYYSASQFSDPTKCPVSLELEDSRPIRSIRSQQHEQFLNDLYIVYKENKKLFNKFLNTINENGIGLISQITFQEFDIPSSSYKVKSGGKITKIDRNRKLVIPYIDVDNVTLSPNQLSEGTFKTLAIVFYILTDENQLLVIEEPEVCVHHGLLDSIISLIISQAKAKQIFISTHSDFVLDRLEPENIIIVKKEKANGTIAKMLNKTLSKNDFEALKTYLAQTGNLGEYWKEGGLENG